MPAPTPTSISDNEVLVRAQRGDFSTQEMLPQRFGRFLAAVARRRCFKLRLPDEDIKDIVQAVYARAIDPTTNRFSPDRCSATRFLAMMAFNEAKHLKLQYQHRADATRKESQQPDADGTFESNPVDLVADGRAVEAINAIESRLVFDRLLARERLPIKRAMIEHYVDGAAITELAKAAGMSRFQLSRALSRCREDVALLIATPGFLTVHHAA